MNLTKALPPRMARHIHPGSTDDCWEYEGSRDDKGYGIFAGAGVSSRMVHRITYEAAVGPIPSGLEIDHLCRNRACVNPWHLEAVTHRVNVARGLSGRFRCEHPDTESNSYVSPRGRRECLACRRERKRAWREARRLSGKRVS